MKHLLVFLITTLPLVANAEAIEINGIYYNLVSKTKTAEVTSNPNKYSGDIIIPSSVYYEENNYSVTSIGWNAFRSCKALTSVTIPNSVTSIDGYAISLCSSLTTLNIPNSVKSIGFYAFEGCSSLVSVTIGSGVESIGERAFRDCKKLSSIQIIDLAAWCNITWGEDALGGYHLFLNGEEIKNLVIPNNVTSISERAFSNCSSLTSVTIPNSVTSVGHKAFSSCINLASIIIPNSVTSIEDQTFYNCSSLTSVTIPNSVKSIGSYAFDHCTGLTSVTIGNNVTSINYNAFSCCSSLTSITIPNSVISINNAAFSNCSGLTSVNIGSGVKTIGSYAFASCPELTDLYCYAESVPSTNSNAFEGSHIDYATLHVPSISVNVYKLAEPWKNFKTIVALDGTTPDPQKCAKPSITYQNGQLKMNCATDGVQFVTNITDADIKKHYDQTISLTATYNVSVYATKSGYENSDVSTVVLCWIDQAPAISTGSVNVPALPILIKGEDGWLTVEGADDGTQVSVYTMDGMQVGSAISSQGSAVVGTNLNAGNAAIVKVGNKSIKVIMK